MSSIEERLTEQIVQKTSNHKTLATVAAVVFLMLYVALFIPHVPFALVGGGLAATVLALFIATRRPRGFRFLPEGIDELGQGGTSTFIAYADIDSVHRMGDEVTIVTRGRIVRLGREGSREPYVTDVIAELAAYLEANVAEAHALAEDRETVAAFLARGAPTGDDYRSAPAPRSALEAVARSRVMPARLRVEAAQALGEELSEEPSNASENERRRV